MIQLAKQYASAMGRKVLPVLYDYEDAEGLAHKIQGGYNSPIPYLNIILQ